MPRKNKKQQKMSPTSMECNNSSDNYKDQLDQDDGSDPSKDSHSANPISKLGNSYQQIPTKPKLKPNQCDICFKTFKQKGYVKDHRRTHTGEKPFTCECGKSYSFKHRLQYHLVSGNCGNRSDEGPEKAQPEVGERKTTKSEKKPHQCQFCSKEFKTKGHMEMHERVHTGNRPYRCDLCGKSFKQSGHVLIHKRGVHNKGSKVESDCRLKSNKNMKVDVSESVQKQMCTSNKHNSVSTKNLVGSLGANSPQTANELYKCEFCLKTFMHEKDLLLHKKMHELKTGPFECHTCRKSFKIRSNLYRHELVHTGEKPYICEICGKSCTQKSNLKSHMTRIHRAIYMGRVLRSEVVSSSNEVETDVKDSTMNAYKEHDKLTNAEELQNKAECPKSLPCQEVQKDANCTINKTTELRHLCENNTAVTPPSRKVNKDRNLFTELKSRKLYYENVSFTAGNENSLNPNKKVSDLNNNDSKSKESGFVGDNLSERSHTEIDKQSTNLHSESMSLKWFHQQSEESSFQESNSIAQNEPRLLRIGTEAKINRTEANESSKNFEEAGNVTSSKGNSDVSQRQEKLKKRHLSGEVGEGGAEKMFVCCECGDKFDNENSMITHCVDIH